MRDIDTIPMFPEFPNGRFYSDVDRTKAFNVIYVDPPWRYRNKTTGGSMKSGSKDKYATMTLDEIMAFGDKIRIIRSRDSVLFLWATVPLLHDALHVMKEWGFQYRTMVTWHKTGILGMGYWFRGVCEHLLFGISGKVRAFRCQLPNIIHHDVLEHSEKPQVFRELIEEATASMPYRRFLELFARKRVEPWEVWGLEVDSDVNLEGNPGQIRQDVFWKD